MSAISQTLCCCLNSYNPKPTNTQEPLVEGPMSDSMEAPLKTNGDRKASQFNTAAKVHATAVIYPYHIGRAINHPAIL